MKKITYLTFCVLFTCAAFAQDKIADDRTGMNALRADRKIYVVMAVVITILAGLIAYIIRIDRKIRQMEKENRHQVSPYTTTLSKNQQHHGSTPGI